jgi:DNA-binding protein H-NS
MDMTRLTTTPIQQTLEATDTQEININHIPTLKLKQLFKDIEKELKHRQVTDKKKALDKMREIAAEYGLTLSEVLNKESKEASTQNTKKPQAPLPPKYTNPANPSQTWSGKGHQPKWVKEALKEGLTLEELAAKSELPSPKVEPGESQPVLSV